MAVRDRVCGLLKGLAAGDRNRGPLRMACRVCESVIECGRYDGDDVFSRLQSWMEAKRGEDRAFDTGATIMNVFGKIRGGMKPKDAAIVVYKETDSAGVNPAHRNVVLAMAWCIPDSELASCAIDECTYSHAHPLSQQVAAATAVLCRALIRGHDWKAACSLAAESRVPEVRQALLEPRHKSRLDNGGFSPCVLEAAVHFVSHANSFDDALMPSLDFAGGANFCPVLVGAIAGARWGASNIDDEHIDHVDKPCPYSGGQKYVPRFTACAAKLAADWPDQDACL
eukprot:TRINITY_DN2395_c0_g1_i1.p1 TRINITY_DN2395_c0_g1~~TRINITY_DN2395_c0_g1_i1.p1  ORF type:complete len:283 (+),score=42.22 TRINITY_DN2395_c0_g1_i1:30-878(+)